MIFTQSAAREKITTLEARITSLEADLASKDEAIASLEDSIISKDETIAEHVSALQSREEKITELETFQATATAELAAKDEALAEANDSAGKIATETLASIGQAEPLPLGEDPAPVDHMEAMNSMSPGQKRAYWKANRTAIKAQLNHR